jgi:hypothetical protein
LTPCRWQTHPPASGHGLRPHEGRCALRHQHHGRLDVGRRDQGKGRSVRHAQPRSFQQCLDLLPLRADGQPCDAENPYEDAACNTLKLTFSKPAPYFHTVMSLWVTFPAKQENIEVGGENWWNSSKFQIGNGPFVLQSLEPFVRGYFTPNENYWGDKAKTDLEYSYITDTAVSFEAYNGDEFDIIGLAAEDLQVVQADPVLSQEAKIYPSYAGQIQTVAVSTGQRVQEGDLLFVLDNPENRFLLEKARQQAEVLRLKLALQPTDQLFLEQTKVLQQALIKTLAEINNRMPSNTIRFIPSYSGTQTARSRPIFLIKTFSATLYLLWSGSTSSLV